MLKDFKLEKHKFKFIEGKEPLFVYFGLCFAYLVLIGLLIFVYINLIDQVQLEMKFDSEKSFNSVYMALMDSPSKAIRTMEEEGVQGLGIYASNGVSYQILGNAPNTLPLARLSQAKHKGSDSTLGIYFYDTSSKTIEYFRLSRFNVAIETGNFIVGSPKLSAMDLPEIVYIKFSSPTYFRRIRITRINIGLGALVVTGLMALILSIYRNNKRYREELSRNENLVHMGAAARTLTHEIKNPLSALTIQSALLRKTLPTQYSGDLDVMDHEIQRLSNLTNRVSEFLRNPVGTPVRIELVSFVKDISRLFNSQVKVICDDTLSIAIEFDPDRARSVFENIIKNATESTSDRDPEVEVEIRKKRHFAFVEVRDRGDGISKEDKLKLFNPFYTTKIHGSGIGLSISQQFIKARGGTLKIDNREGGGTVVEIVLPCLEDSEV